MEELIARVSAAAGIDPATSEKSIGIILAFLRKESDAPEVEALIAKMPGADAAIAANADAAPSGLMGGLSGMMGGGGVMALAGRLSGAGLSMTEMQSVGKALFAFVRDKEGEDAVGQIASSVPGLGQFV